MKVPSNPVEAAEQHLLEMAHADPNSTPGVQDQARLLEALAWLVDHAGRIANAEPGDLRYQGEKAGALLNAALKVHEAALDNWAGCPETDTPADRQIQQAAKTLQSVAQAVNRAMWQAGRPTDPTVVRQANTAAAKTSAWAAEVSNPPATSAGVEPW